MTWIKNNRRWLAPLAVFGALLMLLGAMLGKGQFCDETDNFVGGMVVAVGGDIYKDFISQHMPVMYYLCAVFRLLGASSIYVYRMMFYICLALLWTVMFVRYHKDLGTVTMLAFPLLYVFEMNGAPQCATAIADQLQAQGFVILLLEYLRYVRYRTFDTKACCWLMLGGLFSLGTAFVSAYSLLFFGVGMLLLRIRWNLQERRPFTKAVKATAVQYAKAGLWVLAPFALLLVWYAVSGNLANFIKGAYQVNTEVYSKYMGGFGTDKLAPFRLCFSDYGDMIRRIFSLPWDWAAARAAVRFAGTVGFLLLLLRKDWLASLLLIPAIVMSGMRGFQDFHAMAYLGLCALMLAYCIQQAVTWLASKKRRWAGAAAAAVALACFVCLGWDYPAQFSEVLHVPDILTTDTSVDMYPNALQSMTDPDDPIHVTTLNNHLYIDANRLPLYSAPSTVPWMWEAYGEEEMRLLHENPPKVIYFYPEYDCWGFKQSEYAPELGRFIEQMYTPLSDYNEDMTCLYVRNDYWEEALERMGYI